MLVRGRTVIILSIALLITGLALPVVANHAPRYDERVVAPTGLPVLTHVPVVAGYEPVPRPAPCLTGVSATDTFYEEDFEDGHELSIEETRLAVGANNLWGVTTWPGIGEDAGHAGDTRLYFGDPAQGDYNRFHVAGVAATPWLELPADPPAVLSFETKWQVEDLTGYDHMFIEAETRDGQVHLLCTANDNVRVDPAGKDGNSNWPSCSPVVLPHCVVPVQWETRAVTLPTDLAGEDVRLRFTFDTADGAANWYMGWMIDGIKVGTGLG